MRKKIQIVGVSLMMGMMCGCLEEVPLTDTELDVVAEYAADVLLDSDDKFNSALLSKIEVEQLLTPTPTPTPTLTPVPTPTSITQSSDNKGSASQGQTTVPTITPLAGDSEETKEQLTQLVGQEGFRLSYQGYDIEDSIISNEYYRLEAKDGKQYIVVEFGVENQTDKELVFDASDKKLTCTLAINTDNRYRASLSMLENDLQYMPITVPAKATKQAVIIFEVNKEEIDTINLILENENDNVVFIKMK